AAFIDAVDPGVRTDGEPMGALGEQLLAPRAQEGAVAAIHDHARLVASEEVDVVLRVDVDADAVAVREAGRQLLPAGDDFVAQSLCGDHKGTLSSPDGLAAGERPSTYSGGVPRTQSPDLPMKLPQRHAVAIILEQTL